MQDRNLSSDCFAFTLHFTFYAQTGKMSLARAVGMEHFWRVCKQEIFALMVSSGKDGVDDGLCQSTREMFSRERCDKA